MSKLHASKAKGKTPAAKQRGPESVNPVKQDEALWETHRQQAGANSPDDAVMSEVDNTFIEKLHKSNLTQSRLPLT